MRDYMSAGGVYLLDNGRMLVLWVGTNAATELLSQVSFLRVQQVSTLRVQQVGILRVQQVSRATRTQGAPLELYPTS